ncbi:hypothetical protein CEV31_2700 [Brucella thiophenivorans]|uniref:Uncharacterized protein n=1 Tax=Brucella thiophenivorans TaxID=571255 RepID=A0A256FN44_9HYPH|nr:hypothetical protein CEV31_2700 [Brucella thiophenivorans]
MRASYPKTVSHFSGCALSAFILTVSGSRDSLVFGSGEWS